MLGEAEFRAMKRDGLLHLLLPRRDRRRRGAAAGAAGGLDRRRRPGRPRHRAAPAGQPLLERAEHPHHAAQRRLDAVHPPAGDRHLRGEPAALPGRAAAAQPDRQDPRVLSTYVAGNRRSLGIPRRREVKDGTGKGGGGQITGGRPPWGRGPIRTPSGRLWAAFGPPRGRFPFSRTGNAHQSGGFAVGRDLGMTNCFVVSTSASAGGSFRTLGLREGGKPTAVEREPPSLQRRCVGGGATQRRRSGLRHRRPVPGGAARPGGRASAGRPATWSPRRAPFDSAPFGCAQSRPPPNSLSGQE